MNSFYLSCSGGHSIAALYEPARATPLNTSVLLVPPFGWDDQTSYRPRRDWSKSLAAHGFSNLRIEFPGTGDSSGAASDDGLIDAWTSAVEAGVQWLRNAGAGRVAVIALGVGGLVTLQAIARGTVIDDLTLWGTPANGRAYIRELGAFGRLEQSQTGEQRHGVPADEVRAGGHMLTLANTEALAALDSSMLLAERGPARALVLGRDGLAPPDALLEALRSSGAKIRTDPGYGWGAALARAQSSSPLLIFETVNRWLAESALAGMSLTARAYRKSFEFGPRGMRFRETPVAFDGAGHRLYAVVTEPLDAPLARGTVVLFNAGAIRRIGPNRMWTDAARRWAARGVPVIRLDVEGIGDADGDGSRYVGSDQNFYTQELVEQSRAALDFAAKRGLPTRFILGGLCSGAFWSFQLALSEPRVEAVIALNPRMLIFDADGEGGRELRKLMRILTPRGFRNLLREKQKLARCGRLMSYLAQTPVRLWRGPAVSTNALVDALRTLQIRGQSVHIGFSLDEPLFDEMQHDPGLAQMNRLGIEFYELPYRSHTLKPLKAQNAAHAMLDEVVHNKLL